MATVIALPNGRRPVGYEFVRQIYDLSAFTVQRPATVRPVARVEQELDHLAVPQHVAPASDDPLEHLLFALKHEGTNLQVLAQALPKLPGERLVAELNRTPMGAYVRVLAYLWEQFTGNRLPQPVNVGGRYAELFSSERYITGPVRRDARWRVDFNGLGDLRLCATVERTSGIRALLEQRVLERTREFVAQMPRDMLDRALAWAYLSETRSSYAIEREDPPQDKAEAFARLLQHAHEPRALSEQYLVELQNSIITNPLTREVQLRTQQNWLRDGSAGAVGVTYVPPPPQEMESLMRALVDMVNDPRLCGREAAAIDPLVMASIVKFAFVFIHPFMDGNGRLSRFLFHYVLAQSGALPSGMLLPVSIAMKRHEDQYLHALRAFSRPARQAWAVRWAGEDEFTFEFRGDPSIYRYWDATPMVEFGMRMAAEALEHDLNQETLFLHRYDRLAASVNAAMDLPNPALVRLVRAVLQQGRISNNLRHHYRNTLTGLQFDEIERLSRQTIAPEDTDAEPPQGDLPLRG